MPGGEDGELKARDTRARALGSPAEAGARCTGVGPDQVLPELCVLGWCPGYSYLIAGTK